MNERKIIGFGKASYIITLPNNWIKENKLEKGSVVITKEMKDSLVVEVKKKIPTKEVVIHFDDLPLKILNKKIISYYLKNYKYIKLKGEKVIERLEEIRIFKEKLSSIEIYEIGKDYIILKDLSDASKFEVYDLLNKITNMISVLFDEVVDKQRHNFISQIDSNINKLTFLSYKTINYNLDNMVKIEENKHAIHLWRMVTSLETIGDILKRIARYLNRDKENAKKLQILIISVKEYYDFIIKLINTKANIDNNLKLYLDRKQSLLKEIEEGKNNSNSHMNLYLVVTQLLKDLIGNLDNVALSVIDIHFE
ncbi:MAG: AbrB/MazE/SpoVT family DNA-binding domain-containing protein [Nanoarchaeota archaeon]